MWVLKMRGETFYVHHVECSVPWSTKETPDNAHTKGAIKVKSCLVTIGDDNCAVIRPLTEDDKLRIAKSESVRVITSYGAKLRTALETMQHGPIKLAGGGCGTTWYIVDIPSKKHYLLLQMSVTDVRVLMPNEDYYKLYDKHYGEPGNWLEDEDLELDWEDFYDN
jgi:hypothetical protein